MSSFAPLIPLPTGRIRPTPLLLTALPLAWLSPGLATGAAGGGTAPAFARVFSPAPVAAQEGGAILEEAIRLHHERTAEIDDYTLTQEVMGFRTTIHLRKRDENGEPVFRVVDSGGQGAGSPDEALLNPYSLLPELRGQARLEGTVTVDGHATHRIRIEDFEDADLRDLGLSGTQGRFEPRSGTIYLDVDDLVLRRIELRGRMSTGRAAREDDADGADADDVDDVGEDDTPRGSPVSMEADLRNYRSVEGLLHPFLMEVRVEGLAEALSEQEHRQIESLRESMDSLPEARRKMMVEMMGPEMKQLETVLETGVLELTVRVIDLRVNQGRHDRGS